MRGEMTVEGGDDGAAAPRPGGGSEASADGSIASSRSVAHGVRRLDWSGCVNGPVHPEQYIAL